jgi:hypothetical protein
VAREPAALSDVFCGRSAIDQRMSTSVVTGGNRGIGLALVRALKARGTVIAACRMSSPGLGQRLPW